MVTYSIFWTVQVSKFESLSKRKWLNSCYLLQIGWLLHVCDSEYSIYYSLVRQEVTKKMLGPCPLPLSAFAQWLPAFWSCPNDDPYNLLNHWRYKLSVKTKKFRIDSKGCKKILFFKCVQSFTLIGKRDVISDCIKLHGDFFYFLNRCRYELSVRIKKFRIDLKGCNIDYFF